MNFDSPLMQDEAVRKAISMAIDKQGFVDALLHGNGYPAAGPFPDTFVFGGDAAKAESYDLDGARRVLDDARWKDEDGDGVPESVKRMARSL
jgi:peptide/nickel transport system substrate-binding protein